MLSLNCLCRGQETPADGNRSHENHCDWHVQGSNSPCRKGFIYCNTTVHAGTASAGVAKPLHISTREPRRSALRAPPDARRESPPTPTPRPRAPRGAQRSQHARARTHNFGVVHRKIDHTRILWPPYVHVAVPRPYFQVVATRPLLLSTPCTTAL